MLLKMAPPKVFLPLFAIVFVVFRAHCSVQKRSDDVDPLQTVVQNQAARIQTLETKLATLENFVSQLSANAHTQVVFAAHMTRDSVNIAQKLAIVFDAVTTNIGNGYNSLTGVFTAPVSGVYVFYFQIMDFVSGTTIHAGIVKEGTMLGMTTAEGDSNTFDKGSCMVAAHVTKGEQVYVKHDAGGTTLTGSWWSAFSGTLVTPDAA